MQTPSRVATAALTLGALGVLAAALAPAAIHAGLLAPMGGFSLFGLGALLGIAAVVVGGAALWWTRPASGRAGRPRAVAGASLGALLMAVVFFAGSAGRDLPPVNDITTDPADPPEFRTALQIEANRGRDMGYAGGELAEVTRRAYPDLQPIRVSAPPVEIFRRAERAARALGWEIRHRDAAAGRIEAQDVTPIFQFVDDVAIRIRPAEGGSVVDVRSKSRDGRGDLGANAARIRAFRERLLED